MERRLLPAREDGGNAKGVELAKWKNSHLVFEATPTMAFKGRFQPLCRTRVRKVKKPGESDRITVRPLHDCLALR
jgi:hypothetical protein